MLIVISLQNYDESLYDCEIFGAIGIKGITSKCFKVNTTYSLVNVVWSSILLYDDSSPGLYCKCW